MKKVTRSKSFQKLTQKKSCLVLPMKGHVGDICELEIWAIGTVYVKIASREVHNPIKDENNKTIYSPRRYGKKPNYHHFTFEPNILCIGSNEHYCIWFDAEKQKWSASKNLTTINLQITFKRWISNEEHVIPLCALVKKFMDYPHSMFRVYSLCLMIEDYTKVLIE